MLKKEPGKSDLLLLGQQNYCKFGGIQLKDEELNNYPQQQGNFFLYLKVLRRMFQVLNILNISMQDKNEQI